VSLPDDIPSRLDDIRIRIAQAAARAGRDAAHVRLVAVSKTFDADSVRAAAAAGQLDFGENRVQEALQKKAGLTDFLIKWHLIGPLQSNKARKAAEAFAWIHSIESVDLLRRLDRAAMEAATAPRVLVQVDLAGEATKHGAPPEAVRAILEAGRDCRTVRVVGLMTLPPWFDDADGARPYFRRLRQLRDRLRDEGTPADMLQELSMGMSHDFETAVEEGATIVRVGTAIFGQRTPR